MAGKKKEGGTAASKLDNISASKHVVAGQLSLTSFFGVSAGSAKSTAASTIDTKKEGGDDDGPPPMLPAVEPKKTIDNGGNFADENDVNYDDDDAMISPGKKENVANDKGATRKAAVRKKKQKR